MKAANRTQATAADRFLGAGASRYSFRGGDAATTGVPTARSESSSAGSEAVSGLRGVLSTLTKKQRDYEELITLQSEMLEHYEDVLMSVTAPVARVVDPSE